MSLFDGDFQARLIAALVRGERAAVAVLRIDPELFDPDLSDIVRVLRPVFRKAGAASADQIRQVLKSKRISIPERILKVKGRLSFVDECLITTAEIELGVRNRIIQATQLLDEGDTEEAGRLVGYSAKTKINEKLSLIEWDGVVRRDAACPLGIAAFDTDLNGGLCAGELGVVMAASGDGKSSLLVTMSCRAALRGHRVLFISCELSREMVAQRCVSCLAGMPDTAKNKKLRVDRARKGLKKNKGSIDIQFAVPGAFHLGSILTDQAPTFLVIDAPEFLSSTTDKKTEFRLRMQAIVEEILSVSATLDIPVWISWQSNRESYGTEVALKNVAESLAIVRGATAVIGLMRKKENEAHAVLLKNRVGPPMMRVKLKADYSTFRFQQVDAWRMGEDDLS